MCLPWLSVESNAKLKGFGREIPRSHTSHDSCFQATSSSWHRALAYSNRGQFGGFCGLSWTLDSETVFRCGSEPTSVSKLVRKERLVGRRVEFLFVLEFLPSLPCPLRCSHQHLPSYLKYSNLHVAPLHHPKPWLLAVPAAPH